MFLNNCYMSQFCGGLYFMCLHIILLSTAPLAPVSILENRGYNASYQYMAKT